MARKTPAEYDRLRPLVLRMHRARYTRAAITATFGVTYAFVDRVLAGAARPETPPEKPRQRRHPCRYPFLRKVQGEKYQLRLYIGGPKGQGTSVNLGLFASEWEAGQAFKAVARLLHGPPDPLSIWQQVKPLMAAGVLPPTLLPKYVFRRPDGTFGARRGLGDPGIGPFDSPEEAYRAMTARLAEKKLAVAASRPARPRPAAPPSGPCPTPPPKTCEACGREYTRYKRRSQRYCSKACVRRARRASWRDHKRRLRGGEASAAGGPNGYGPPNGGRTLRPSPVVPDGTGAPVAAIQVT